MELNTKAIYYRTFSSLFLYVMICLGGCMLRWQLLLRALKPTPPPPSSPSPVGCSGVIGRHIGPTHWPCVQVSLHSCRSSSNGPT